MGAEEQVHEQRLDRGGVVADAVVAPRLAGRRVLQLRLRLAPFRRAQFRSEQRLVQSHEEHGALVRQVLRGDGDEAARLMRAHMLNASATLANYLGETAAANEPDDRGAPPR